MLDLSTCCGTFPRIYSYHKSIKISPFIFKEREKINAGKFGLNLHHYFLL